MPNKYTPKPIDMVIELLIKPIETSQLDILDVTFGSEFDRTHADDLRDQSAGDKTFLIAWVNNQPVGHALTRWLGPRADVPQSLYPACPEIYRLAVLEEFQRQGIATAIIGKCEAEAKLKGFKHIGLGTDPDLPPNSNLYYRLGYKISEAVRFKESYQQRRDDGSVETVNERTTFVIKTL